MFLVLTWKTGVRPKLVQLPADVVSIVRAIVSAARSGHEIEIYSADNGTLTLVYSEAEAEDVTLAAGLVPK